jgi:ankyrin repeat protein
MQNMSTHQTILDLFLKLGYPKTAGICYGVSVRWLEACLLGEESLFDARVKRIEKIMSSGADIVQLVNAVKTKKGKNLTPKDKELLDILAFFDSLELYQSPEQHSALFNLAHGNSQLDITPHSYFASADKIHALGGLNKVYSEPMILTSEEIKKYLDELAIILQTNGSSTDTFGLLLSSSDHTMTLSYTTNVGWGFMDINQYPAQFYKMGEAWAVNLLSERIVAGFGSTTPIAFDASLITLKNSASLSKLTISLEQFKAGHVINKELAAREHNGVGLAFIAAEHGHVSVISKLAKHGVDLNKADKDGQTPAFKAAQYGHVSVIAELAKHKVDLNKANNNGVTPVFFAAQYGQVSVIAELAQQKVDLDKTDNYGATPAMWAAYNGHVSVIAELAKHKVDLNKEGNDGLTPAMWAAKKGHPKFLAELIKHNIDLNKTNKAGDTLAYLAAQAGHTSVIAELARHKLDLNKANNNGGTPALAAAANGHPSVIEALAKNNVDMNKARNGDMLLSLTAAGFGHASVIAELAKHNVDLNKANNNGLTPASIAATLGHVSVIAELAKHNVDFDKVDNEGYPPLSLAAANGKVSVLAELAKHNVDPNKISSNAAKTTALHLAVKHGHIDCALFLIKAGGYLMVKDSQMKTPLDYAEENRDQPMIQLIKNSLKAQKERLDTLEKLLDVIKNKAKELKQKKCDVAYKVARNLYTNLSVYKNQCSKNEINYPQFKEQSLSAIKLARTELEKHRGWKEVLANILFCVAGLGVFYMGACWYQGSFFKFKTDSEKKLDVLAQHIEETTSALTLI